MRRIIKSAAVIGFRPADVRGMIPRDWMLIVAGHDDAAAAKRPGANAPSDKEISDLVERYG